MVVRRLSSGDPMDIRMFIPLSPHQQQQQKRAVMVQSNFQNQKRQMKNEEDPRVRMERLKSLQAKKDLVISKRKQSLSSSVSLGGTNGERVSLVQFKSRRKNFAPQSGWARSRYIPQNA
jgi:hypothetical protein